MNDGYTNWFEVVALLITTIGTCFMGWIAYKQSLIGKEQLAEKERSARREHKLDTLTTETHEQTNLIKGQQNILNETKQVAVEAKLEASIAAEKAAEAARTKIV